MAKSVQATATLMQQIREAFADVEYPSGSLRNSNQGDEPFLVELDFIGKIDRYSIPSEFLDQSPKGLSSSLSFLSDNAFQFFLPAYLVADLSGGPERVDLVFHLCYGLDNNAGKKPFDDKTLFDLTTRKYSKFTREQAQVIVNFLRLKHALPNTMEHTKLEIGEALKNFWFEKAGLARIASSR